MKTFKTIQSYKNQLNRKFGKVELGFYKHTFSEKWLLAIMKTDRDGRSRKLFSILVIDDENLLQGGIDKRADMKILGLRGPQTKKSLRKVSLQVTIK